MHFGTACLPFKPCQVCRYADAMYLLPALCYAHLTPHVIALLVCHTLSSGHDHDE